MGQPTILCLPEVIGKKSKNERGYLNLPNNHTGVQTLEHLE